MLLHFKERFLNGKFANEVIMDDSAALQLSNILVFTGCKTMVDYLNECFEALFNHATPPACYIRLDRSHFVNSINRCKKLNAADKTKKKFYKRILGYLMLSDDINDCERVIENMFILLKNEYVYNDRVIQAKNDMEMIVKSHKHIIEENSHEDYIGFQELEEDETINIKTKSSFSRWIYKIASNVDRNFVDHELNNSMGETQCNRNPYVSHQLEKPLKKILSKISLFSNVMNAVFESQNTAPSSSSLEAQFRNLKSYVFKSKKGLRLDTWLERSIEITTGIFKTMVAELNEQKKADQPKKRKRVQMNNIELDSPSVNKRKKRNLEEENWKNQNIDAKNIDQANHVKRVKRSHCSILNTLNTALTGIPILSNGGKSKKVGEIPTIYSTNTCGPDSILHLLAVCYADNCEMKRMVDEDDSECGEFIRLIMSSDAAKERDRIDAMRNSMLVNLFPENVIDLGKHKTIDCAGYITNIYKRFCSFFPLLYSTQTMSSCCPDSFTESEFIRFKLKNVDVNKLQESILLPKHKYKCETCGKMSTSVTQGQFFAAFDCESSLKHISLNEIQREIKIGPLKYKLLGVIEYKPTIKHFVAFALRSVGSTCQWFELDDLDVRAISHDDFVVDSLVLILFQLSVVHVTNREAEEVIQPAKQAKPEKIETSEKEHQPKSAARGDKVLLKGRNSKK